MYHIEGKKFGKLQDKQYLVISKFMSLAFIAISDATNNWWLKALMSL